MSGIDSYTATPQEALRRSLVAAVDPINVCDQPGEEHWVNDIRFVAMPDGNYAQLDFDGRYGRSMLTMGGYELKGARADLHGVATIIIDLAQRHTSCARTDEAWVISCDDDQLAAALLRLDNLGVTITAF